MTPRRLRSRGALAAALAVAVLAALATVLALTALRAPAQVDQVDQADPYQGYDRADHDDPAEVPGPSRAVGPVGTPCAGVAADVGSDLQALIDASPAATTFCLSAGTHRIQTPLSPKRGDAFIGAPGAVLSGSRVLDGWRRDGSGWSAAAFLPSTPATNGECRATAPLCTQAEDVFVDGRRLLRVGERSAVVPGTVYADYSTNTVTIGDDPGGHLVEQAVAPSLVRSVVDGVVIAGLVLEQAASPAQTAAIEARQVSPEAAGSGWRVLNNEVRLNHGIGIGIGGGSIVSGNVIRDQGQLGFAVWGTGSTVSDNEVSANGGAGYSYNWEAGGCKIWATDRVTLAHNDVHDNLGPGLWADGGNIRTVYRYNRITGNWGAGIQHEISYDAVIRHNDISGNGRTGKGWVWEAGIQIQSSGGTGLIEVAYNTVHDNANGITLVDSGDRTTEQPAPHGPHIVRNVWVHDNTVAMGAGQVSGAVQDSGSHDVFTANRNVFDYNTYLLDSLSAPHFAWADRQLRWGSWQEQGVRHDPHGRAARR